MSKIKVTCYSNEKGKDLLSLCIGHIDGAYVNSCHPYWYRGCESQKRCRRFFPEGISNLDTKLATLLNKTPSAIERMAWAKRDEKIDYFEGKAFKKCKAITIMVKY